MTFQSFKSAVLARLRYGDSPPQDSLGGIDHRDRVIEAAWLANLSDLDAADMVQRATNLLGAEAMKDRFGNTTQRNEYLRTLPDYWEIERAARRGGWLIRIAIVAALLALWAVMH